MARKRKIIDRIEVQDFAAEGKCIAKHEGEVIFILTPNIAPGDVVKLQINRKRKSFSEAIVLERLEPSPMRIEPFCSHFGVCGGCKWQHIPYETQLKQKEKQVIDQLERLGRLEVGEKRPILGSANTQYYRNKLEFTFSNSRWLTADEIRSEEEMNKNALGFHIPKRFEKVLPIAHCYLQADPSNAIRLFFQSYADKSAEPYYDHVKHEGFFRNIMIRTASTGEIMVVVQFAENDKKKIEDCLSAFVQAFPKVHSVNYFINQKRNDSYQDLEPVCVHGKPYIEEEMEGLRFRIGVKSFYQTNSDQAYELYKITREMADIQPEDIVYDLYTGTGTIANFVAKRAKKVVGVEYVEAAIEDAKVNSEINGIDNTSFYAGNMKDVLNEAFLEKEGRPDIVITDPPRAGMDKEVVEMLLKIRAKRIVYVSCNAATQARDIKLMSDYYRVSSVRPVDMFPHTHHVENVALLELN
ncbi:23S rRNA (uracil(1939)-C(5))-methyltransferase RlmD [Marinilongibacter aquaticus]|uniref:23S rRNA (uracil(1939)-C(5))-methyltransferase RlmD n=1 Tax=Marinilongibacter aquaticus TaxID=2975157 RepID=UPI0021BDC1C9|nr:23S rRNA (uracil(1939)-C(5))-methyltransferase RlmD [Marinilongibacter aquaticus]UBM59562.1 23S rRNA (uracil(1939)-C(5))-methyltransferase RlmD [Marinilongibacter aquaticus]